MRQCRYPGCKKQAWHNWTTCAQHYSAGRNLQQDRMVKRRLKPMTREEFKAARAAGRLFCWATLNERQDFMVHLGGDTRRPVREITDEPPQHHRAIGGPEGPKCQTT
jgi:nickel-dependent lactate racemase